MGHGVSVGCWCGPDPAAYGREDEDGGEEEDEESGFCGLRVPDTGGEDVEARADGLVRVEVPAIPGDEVEDGGQVGGEGGGEARV